MHTNKENILIVGGGFAGVKAALSLDRSNNFNVTLITDSNYLRYYPTLYRTATGSSRANSSIPLSQIFSKTNVKIEISEAKSIDRHKNEIITSSGEHYGYDTLILALGVVTNFFGIPGLAEYAYSIKTQDEVARFKKHLHDQIQNDKKPDLNYVIIGAGPTGIELAGSLGLYIKTILKNHGLRNPDIHIDLIEALPRLLPNMPKSISRQVKKRLHKLGVNLYLNSKVQAEDDKGLVVNNKPIRSHSVVWTAGVTTHPFFKNNDFTIMSKGKVAVDVYLQTEPNIFILGDNANTPFSGMAQTALYDGEFVANNLIRRSIGKDMKSYKAKKPVSVIPAGNNWSIVHWGKLLFSGRLGYLIREVADLRGFHSLENWSKALKQYLNEFVSEDDCQVCATQEK